MKKKLTDLDRVKIKMNKVKLRELERKKKMLKEVREDINPIPFNKQLKSSNPQEVFEIKFEKYELKSSSYHERRAKNINSKVKQVPAEMIPNMKPKMLNPDGTKPSKTYEEIRQELHDRSDGGRRRQQPLIKRGPDGLITANYEKIGIFRNNQIIAKGIIARTNAISAFMSLTPKMEKTNTKVSTEAGPGWPKRGSGQGNNIEAFIAAKFTKRKKRGSRGLEIQTGNLTKTKSNFLESPNFQKTPKALFKRNQSETKETKSMSFQTKKLRNTLQFIHLQDKKGKSKNKSERRDSKSSKDAGVNFQFKSVNGYPVLDRHVSAPKKFNSAKRRKMKKNKVLNIHTQAADLVQATPKLRFASKSTKSSSFLSKPGAFKFRKKVSKPHLVDIYKKAESSAPPINLGILPRKAQSFVEKPDLNCLRVSHLSVNWLKHSLLPNQKQEK